jgi:hypothetical protein
MQGRPLAGPQVHRGAVQARLQQCARRRAEFQLSLTWLLVSVCSNVLGGAVSLMPCSGCKGADQQVRLHASAFFALAPRAAAPPRDRLLPPAAQVQAGRDAGWVGAGRATRACVTLVGWQGSTSHPWHATHPWMGARPLPFADVHAAYGGRRCQRRQAGAADGLPLRPRQRQASSHLGAPPRRHRLHAPGVMPAPPRPSIVPRAGRLRGDSRWVPPTTARRERWSPCSS